MLKRMQKSIVCEGVETEEIADFLKKEGCNEIQGFLYYHPMCTEEFETVMDIQKTVQCYYRIIFHYIRQYPITKSAQVLPLLYVFLFDCYFFGTVTVITYFLRPERTVTLALPGFFAVRTPLEETVTTFLFELMQVILSVDVNGTSTGLSVAFFPLRRVSLLVSPLIFVVFTTPFCSPAICHKYACVLEAVLALAVLLQKRRISDFASLLSVHK